MERADLPPELWDIVFSRLIETIDLRTFRSLSKVHRLVAHAAVLREIRGVVRASRVSVTEQMVSLITGIQRGGGHLVYLGRNRARACVALNEGCNAALFLSDRGVAMLAHAGDGKANLIAEMRDIMTCQLEYNHRDDERPDERAKLRLSHGGHTYTHGAHGITGYASLGGYLAPVPAARLSVTPNSDDRQLPRVRCQLFPGVYSLLSDRWREYVDTLRGLAARLIDFLDYLEGRGFDIAPCTTYDLPERSGGG